LATEPWRQSLRRLKNSEGLVRAAFEAAGAAALVLGRVGRARRSIHVAAVSQPQPCRSLPVSQTCGGVRGDRQCHHGPQDKRMPLAPPRSPSSDNPNYNRAGARVRACALFARHGLTARCDGCGAQARRYDSRTTIFSPEGIPSLPRPAASVPHSWRRW
jgi:hypothetical protein